MLILRVALRQQFLIYTALWKLQGVLDTCAVAAELLLASENTNVSSGAVVHKFPPFLQPVLNALSFSLIS